MKSNVNRFLEGTGTVGSKAYFEESIQESVFGGLPTLAPVSASQAPQVSSFDLQCLPHHGVLLRRQWTGTSETMVQHPPFLLFSYFLRPFS